MTGSGAPSAGEEQLLRELADAVHSAKGPVREIEVGIALSIALGRMRPAVSCGGCSTPLEFEGIPTRTNTRLTLPFHLVLSDAGGLIGPLPAMSSLPILETVFDLLTTYMGGGGLLALFALMAVESFGIPPLPSEIILPFAGVLVAAGTYSWTGAILAALAGGLVGAFGAYAVGRYGRGTLERPTGFLRLDPKHLRSMDRWFRRHGEGTVLVARLLPVVRSYISYPAGTSKMEPVRFGAYSLVGAAPFTIVLIYAGFVLGKNYKSIVPYFEILDLFAAAGILILLVYVALRWRHVIGPGFPPTLTRSGGSPPPEPTATPSATDPGSPPP